MWYKIQKIFLPCVHFSACLIISLNQVMGGLVLMCKCIGFFLLLNALFLVPLYHFVVIYTFCLCNNWFLLLTVDIFCILFKKDKKTKSVNKRWNILKKMNSLKKGEGVSLLNFEGGPGVPPLNFEEVSWGSTFKLWGGPGSQVPLLPPCLLISCYYFTGLKACEISCKIWETGKYFSCCM